MTKKEKLTILYEQLNALEAKRAPVFKRFFQKIKSTFLTSKDLGIVGQTLSQLQKETRILMRELRDVEAKLLIEFHEKINEIPKPDLEGIKKEFHQRFESLNIKDFSLDLQNIQTQLQDIVSQSIEQGSKSKGLQEQQQELERNIQKLEKNFILRLSKLGGGNANRNITINSSVLSRKFGDIDFKNSPTISFTAVDNDVNNTVTITASVLTGSQSAAGSDGQLQFNDNGSFGASSTLSWNKNTSVLTATSLKIPSFTQGSIPFQTSSSVLGQDNANLYWDDANNRLGLGTATPNERLQLVGASSRVALSQTAGGRYPFMGIPANDEGGLQFGRSDHSNLLKLTLEPTQFIFSCTDTADILFQLTSAGGNFYFGGSSTNTAYKYFFGLRADMAINMNSAYDFYGGPTTFFIQEATRPGIVIKGFTAQSGDLQHWQDVNSSVLTAISSEGLINKYNRVSTAGYGVPAIYGSGRVTTQSAAAGSVATYTVGAADGSFLVSANVLVTTSSAENFTVTCAYTDEGNTSRTLTLNFQTIAGTIGTAINFANGAVPYEGIPVHIRAKAATSITIATTGTFTGATYNAEATISQIK